MDRFMILKVVVFVAQFQMILVWFTRAQPCGNKIFFPLPRTRLSSRVTVEFLLNLDEARSRANLFNFSQEAQTTSACMGSTIIR